MLEGGNDPRFDPATAARSQGTSETPGTSSMQQASGSLPVAKNPPPGESLTQRACKKTARETMTGFLLQHMPKLFQPWALKQHVAALVAADKTDRSDSEKLQAAIATARADAVGADVPEVTVNGAMSKCTQAHMMAAQKALMAKVPNQELGDAMVYTQACCLYVTELATSQGKSKKALLSEQQLWNDMLFTPAHEAGMSVEDVMCLIQEVANVDHDDAGRTLGDTVTKQLLTKVYDQSLVNTALAWKSTPSADTLRAYASAYAASVGHNMDKKQAFYAQILPNVKAQIASGRFTNEAAFNALSGALGANAAKQADFPPPAAAQAPEKPKKPTETATVQQPARTWQAAKPTSKRAAEAQVPMTATDQDPEYQEGEFRVFDPPPQASGWIRGAVDLAKSVRMPEALGRQPRPPSMSVAPKMKRQVPDRPPPAPTPGQVAAKNLREAQRAAQELRSVAGSATSAAKKPKKPTPTGPDLDQVLTDLERDLGVEKKDK